MFGQRKRREAEAEAARESERLALFARLSERPENICPFLGLAGERTVYVDGVSDEHRCYAFGDPAPLSAEQQTRVCQERGYGNCPRYLRGVLVIPTEELEALRRPHAGAAQAPPAPRAPVAEPRRRRLSPLIGILVVVLLIGIGGGAAFLLFSDQLGIGLAPSPTPSVAATPRPTESPPPATPTSQPTSEPTAEPTLEPTPVVLPSGDEWPPALDTPAPSAVATGWIVAVQAGELPVIRINDDDTVGEDALTQFSRRSGAPVDRRDIDGRRYWVTLAGLYTGLAYVDGFSGDADDFVIFESYRNPDDSDGFLLIPEDER